MMQENSMQDVMMNGKAIGLVKRGDRSMPLLLPARMRARLCDGWLDAQGRIVCPLHKYRFDPANGRNTSGEGYKLKTYPVEIREEYIYIGFTE